jgi:hypothetical protein
MPLPILRTATAMGVPTTDSLILFPASLVFFLLGFIACAFFFFSFFFFWYAHGVYLKKNVNLNQSNYFV